MFFHKKYQCNPFNSHLIGACRIDIGLLRIARAFRILVIPPSVARADSVRLQFNCPNTHTLKPSKYVLL